MIQAPKFLLPLALATMLSACAQFTQPGIGSINEHASIYDMQQDPLPQQLKLASMDVVNQLRNKGFAKDTLVVASSVNLDQIQTPTAFGRLAGELTASHLANAGFSIYEIKLTDNLKMTQWGEFMQTRNPALIKNEFPNATIVILGNWSLSGQFIYGTIKAVRVADGLILSSSSYSLPVNKNTQALLRR